MKLVTDGAGVLVKWGAADSQTHVLTKTGSTVTYWPDSKRVKIVEQL